ncbi:MAG: histone H1 [Bacteroidota bacterium]|jgi:hypothetical protein
MEKFNELKTLVANLEEDATKFYEKDNKAAGVRLRKGLQDIKSIAQELRLDVSDKNKESKKA